MANRDGNFNRPKTRKLKQIRDNRRAKIIKAKNNVKYDIDDSVPLTKKEQRRQKRLDRILKELDTKEQTSFSKRTIKRRNDRKRPKTTQSDSGMVIG